MPVDSWSRAHRTPGNNEKFAAYASRLRVFACNHSLASAVASFSYQSDRAWTELDSQLTRPVNDPRRNAFHYMRVTSNLLLPFLSAINRRSQFTILIFHRVLERQDPVRSDLDSRAFESILATVAKHFRVLPLTEAIQRWQNNDLPGNSLSITFDDGYSDNFHIALPVLHRLGLPATFFVATGFLNGGWMWNDGVIEAVAQTQESVLDLSPLGLGLYRVATVEDRKKAIVSIIPKLKYRNKEERISAAGRILNIAAVDPPNGLMMGKDEVRLLHRSGMEIGGHTVDHPILATLEDAEAFRQIKDNKDRLEELLGRRITMFAYPNGKPGTDYGPQHKNMVRDAGYSAAVSTVWGCANERSDAYELPRFTPWDRSPSLFTLRLIRQCIKCRYAR